MPNHKWALLVLCMTVFGCKDIGNEIHSVKLAYQQEASDIVIHTNIVQILENVRRNLPSEIGLIVLNGKVLLVGYTADSQEHIDCIHAIWKIKGVKEVIDHLEYDPTRKKTGFELNYPLLKTQIDTLLLTNPKINYTHFKYILFNKNLYVLSKTSSETEKDSFFKLIKTLPKIKKVFFYHTYQH